MQKFKSGDRVRILSDGGILCAKVGDIVHVDSVNEDGEINEILEFGCGYIYLNEWYEKVDTMNVVSGKECLATSITSNLVKNGYNYNSHSKKELTSKPKNIMSIITNAFKSKENKALESLGLGSTEELNSDGRAEFINFLFSTMTKERVDFLKKIVEIKKEKE